MKRFTPFVVASVAVGAILLGAPAAEAAPGPTMIVAPTATGPVDGAAGNTRATVAIKVTVSNAAADDAVLSASVPGKVTSGDVRVDGTAAPLGTVDTSAKGTSTDVTARLGAGANALTGGVLNPGTHTVTVTTDLRTLAGGTRSATATLDYLGGGDGAKGTVAIPLPDLKVVPDDTFRTPKSLDVAPNGQAVYFAKVTSTGSGVRAADLTVTLPTGLALDDSESVVRFTPDLDFTPLTCTRTGATVRCTLGKVTGTVYVGIALDATSAAKPGTTGTLVVGARAANDLDATPADNTVSEPVRFVPPAHLRTRLTADRTSVEVGAKAHITVAVTNTGTAPADVYGLVLVVDKLSDEDDEDTRFVITGFTGREEPDAPPAVTGGVPAMPGVRQAAGVAMAARVQAARRGDDVDDNLRVWNIGRLAPGATIKAVLTVEAKHTGAGLAAAYAASALSGTNCLIQNPTEPTRCPEYGQLKLRAVVGAGTSSNGAIAETGFATTQWTGLALGLLLLGALSQYAGRRRVRLAGRHRG